MHFPDLRVPARLIEHPIESLLAAALLLTLLFVSGGDPSSHDKSSPAKQLAQTAPQKM